MKHAEIQSSRFLSNGGAEARAAIGQADLPFGFHRKPVAFHFVAIDLCFFGVTLEERTDGIVAADALDIDDSRLYPLLVDFCAIAMLRKIAFRQSQVLQKFGLEFLSAAFLGELQGTPSIMNDLNRFD